MTEPEKCRQCGIELEPGEHELCGDCKWDLDCEWRDWRFPR